MSNDELWALFPIIIKGYNPDYPLWYSDEKSMISGIIGSSSIMRVSHIGSTAVPALFSKPTVDILLEIADDWDIPTLISKLNQIGYLCTEQPDNPPPHLMFMKGYTTEGFAEKVFHLHVRYSGDWDELYFRDYLRIHGDIAEQYGNLKTKLQTQFEHDRDGYTLAKTDFIRQFTKLAREEFGNKYER